MKKILLIVNLLLVSLIMIPMNNSFTYKNLNKDQIKMISLDREKKEIEELIKDYKDYFLIIAQKESNNNYKAINQYGYLGKYQFGKIALKHIGFDPIQAKDFKQNPDKYFPEHLQDKAMYLFTFENKKFLSKEIKKFVGKKINGITITENGLLAAAHLGGAGNVKKWLYSGIDFQDGNGTRITQYIKMFQTRSSDI